MDVHKLAKVLALAASDNEAEALHALRTAGRLLDNAGLDFVALAERLAGSADPSPAAARTEELEDAVFDLRNEIRHLRAENERLRQGHPQPAAAAPSAGLAGAAQDAALAIRLRAELDAARAEIARLGDEAGRLRHDAGQRDLALRSDLEQAIAAAERLTERFTQAKGRSDRLEAENRRLSLVAAALKAELDERLADRLHPLPPAPSRPEASSRPEAPPRPEAFIRPAPPAAGRRAKTPPPGQYALF